MLLSLISLITLPQISLMVEAFRMPPAPPILENIAAYPVKTSLSMGPILQASSALSVDLETGKTLWARQSTTPLPIASLTKLMTVLVILDQYSPDELVTVDKRAITVEPAKIYLLANEKISVRELIKAILIKSANDAALALAYHDSNTLEEFATKMNAKAAQLGMGNSNFINPTGFDAPGQYSTAEDLAILARAIYKNSLIREYAQLTTGTATSVDGAQKHELNTTNDLLSSYLKVWGLKTGTTELAGQCLISIVESPTGQKILNVILNSPNRFTESKILSQWIFNNYQWL